MASWQAYVSSWIIKRRLKPKLLAAQSLAELRKLLTPPPYRLPSGVRITPESAGGIPGEWVEGPQPDGRTLLYLHGGGYFACSPETHRPITAAFACHGFRVYAPDYRLAPEHPYPAALEDAVAVYRSLLERGIAPGNLVLAGDSAGGGLTVALLVALRDRGVPLPAAAALLSPWTDLAATGDSVRTNAGRCAMFHPAGIEKGARLYLGDGDPRNPLASPLYADLRGLPPLLIHVSKSELLLDDSVRLAERARSAGGRVELKIWPVVPHVWQLGQATIPEARESLRECAGFLRTAAAVQIKPVHAGE